MKAVLLAAGKGERLGKFTETTPKPMLPVMGKPVIVHNIEMCHRFGITDIYINLHHLPEVITDYLADGQRFGVNITYSREEIILGTAGGVKRMATALSGERFFVIYADNYSNYDLKQVYDSHLSAEAEMSIAVFELENTSQSGIVAMDDSSWIQIFVEKPEGKLIDSHWVNAGIYLIEPELLNLIPDGFSDFGRDIIPDYLNGGRRILGVKMPTPVLAIDTPALLGEVEKQVKNSNAQPLVSILITTCNRPDYLDKCLASILIQDYQNYEILIMDDHPDAQSESVVKKYQALFDIGSNYQHIRNEPRLGYQRSLNRGLIEARGDYIARLDDDDTWAESNKLSQQVAFLEANPEYILVGTGVIVVAEDGTEMFRSLMLEDDKAIREKMLQQNSFVHSSVVYRKTVALALGGYHEDKWPYSEDYDLWVKLGTAGKLANLPIYGVRYTVMKRGIAYNFKFRTIPEVRSIGLIRKYRDKYPNYWQAVSLRPVQIIDFLLHMISDVPPFSYIKRFFKNRFPALWQAMTSIYRGIFPRA